MRIGIVPHQVVHLLSVNSRGAPITTSYISAAQGVAALSPSPSMGEGDTAVAAEVGGDCGSERHMYRIQTVYRFGGTAY